MSTSAELKHHGRRPSSASVTPSSHSAQQGSNATASLQEAYATASEDADSEIAEAWNTIENIEELGLAFGPYDMYSSPCRERFVLDDIIPEECAAGGSTKPAVDLRPPFEKWLKSLNKKKTRRRAVSDSRAIQPLYRDSMDGDQSRHRKSLSGSSFAFVTAIKSASVSMASLSIAPRSRNMGRSSKYTRTDRSSRTSHVGTRNSEDSTHTARGIVNDTAVNSRALRRRHVLEEIITTEEGYCSDIKFLVTVRCMSCF